MQKFKAKVNVLQTAFVIIWYFSLCRYHWSICRRIDNSHRNVEVLASEVSVLLFRHVEVGTGSIIVLVYLYLRMFLDNLAEGQHKVSLVELTLQRIYILRLGVFLQEVDR